MNVRKRETLKNYFGDGQLPTQVHFADLIDSMLNMADEGFRKTVANGQELYAPVGHETLMSFYRGEYPQEAKWKMNLGADDTQLQFQRQGFASPLLSLDQTQRVGIGITKPPQSTLDVGGTVSSQGRRGSRELPPGEILADGKWHDLTGDLRDCQAFEVMAGAGRKDSGHFGLVHAIALSAYNPGGLLAWRNARRGIRQTQAWWGRRCDRLELRWDGTHGDKAVYRLQIRTGCNFGKDVKIQAQVCELWSDSQMSASQPASATQGGPR